MLESGRNEWQDLSTIMNSLFIYKYQHPESSDFDLADVLTIPNLTKGMFLVEAPYSCHIQHSIR